MRSRLTIALVLAVLAATLVAVASGRTRRDGCGGACDLPQGAERVAIDPADFTTRIDNAWWPMQPGSRWVYRETAPDGTVQRVVVTVLHRTKLIANGVRARVVHDVVTEDGKPVEVTDDWYAQDRCGNVWYFGEATNEYENGKVGVDEGLVRGGRRRRAGGRDHAGEAEAGHALPAGVLRRAMRRIEPRSSA